MAVKNGLDIVEELTAEIQRSGISISELALASGVSQRQIYYVLGGKAKNVGMNVITRLARAIDLRLALVRAPNVHSAP